MNRLAVELGGGRPQRGGDPRQPIIEVVAERLAARIDDQALVHLNQQLRQGPLGLGSSVEPALQALASLAVGADADVDHVVPGLASALAALEDAASHGARRSAPRSYIL